MSDATLRGVEEAILAHYKNEFQSQHDADPDRRSDMVVDWVVGYTISGVVEVEGKSIVGYSNQTIEPRGNPNAHLGLSTWMVGEYEAVIDGRFADDDDDD